MGTIITARTWDTDCGRTSPTSGVSSDFGEPNRRPHRRTRHSPRKAVPWTRSGWRRGSARTCRPSRFFPSDGVGVEVARRICADCPVQEACLEHALVNRIDHGVWGGCSERERRRILKHRRQSLGLLVADGPPRTPSPELVTAPTSAAPGVTYSMEPRGSRLARASGVVVGGVLVVLHALLELLLGLAQGPSQLRAAWRRRTGRG